MGETTCRSCGTDDGVCVRNRRVYGWLGVQRYLDANDYGIDFLRHGRKIEIASRDLFFWKDDTRKVSEYPIDDPRGRGRLVGEIHLDHCRVSYTKDRFERTDVAWEEMVRIVRGEGPLRPDKAASLGFPPNPAPLFRLFQAFRRSTPKPKIAGCYKRILAIPDNELAREYATRFQAGEAEYQSDAKWWELIEEADRQLLVGEEPEPGGDDGAKSVDELLGGGGSSGEDREPVVDDDTTEGVEGEEGAIRAARHRIASLSRQYRDGVSDQKWDITAYAVAMGDPSLSEETGPWSLENTGGGQFEFLVQAEHEVFRSATITPLDALLVQLAWSAMDFTRGTQHPPTFSSVLARLRKRYARSTTLDPVSLSMEASRILRAIATAVGGSLMPGESRSLFEGLSTPARDDIVVRLVRRFGPEPDSEIESGRFLEYIPGMMLLHLFEGHPHLFFDGRYWDIAFSALELGSDAVTAHVREEISRRFTCILWDAVWLADNSPEDLAEAGRARLLRASLALDLLDSELADEESWG